MLQRSYVFGYNVSIALVQVLKQCGNDLSRENVMRQAANLKDLEAPALLPGIKINTNPTNYHPMRQLQLERWDGRLWYVSAKFSAAHVLAIGS